MFPQRLRIAAIEANNAREARDEILYNDETEMLARVALEKNTSPAPSAKTAPHTSR